MESDILRQHSLALSHWPFLKPFKTPQLPLLFFKRWTLRLCRPVRLSLLLLDFNKPFSTVSGAFFTTWLSPVSGSHPAGRVVPSGSVGYGSALEIPLASRAVPLALTLLRGVSPGAWGIPKRGMPTWPEAFLELPDVCGLRPCDRTHLKKRPCATLVRLVGRMTNIGAFFTMKLSRLNPTSRVRICLTSKIESYISWSHSPYFPGWVPHLVSFS